MEEPTRPTPSPLEPPTVLTEDVEGVTAQAPPFRAPTPGGNPMPGPLLGLPAVGQTINDFELLRVLGSGSFARVYLARQTSLGRQVALKVSVNRGNEARTLAALEHDHIVRVFSEVVDSLRDLRLLCMQYVPGAPLECIIESIARQPGGRPSGQAILAIVDEQVRDAAALDLAALRDRELLADLDFIEAGCWMAARLAEALAHAHGLGVLHRDVKPANILVNRYGRPLLVDFNVSTTSISPVQKTGSGRRDDADGDEPLGGTLAYMSPEHLDAFRGNDSHLPVDARSDIYSLGIVFYELLAGRLPFDLPDEGRSMTAIVQTLADQRRAGVPLLPADLGAPPAVQRVIARCLAPRPEDRFGNAAEMAEALDGCREMRRVERDMPPGGRVTRLALRKPFLVAAGLVLLPQVLGSIVNVSYNALRIGLNLSEEQKAAFPTVVLAYNLILYPLCLFILFRQTAPVFRTWRRLSRPGPIDAAEVSHARRKALQLPLWGMAMACLGWLPGGVIFPLALDLTAGPVLLPVYLHFAFSFTISGLIALTYSTIAIEFVVVRVLYPGLWVDARDLQQTARRELQREEGRLAMMQFLAVLIPLAAATLMLSVGPGDFTPASYSAFRLLVTALLGVGMLGLGLAILAGQELRQARAAFSASGRRR